MRRVAFWVAPAPAPGPDAASLGGSHPGIPDVQDEARRRELVLHSQCKNCSGKRAMYGWMTLAPMLIFQHD